MRSLVSDPSSSADGSTAGDEGGGVVSRRRVGARVDADAARAAMPPPAPRPARAPRVLDEDEWTARLDAIITRDYFPDVPALRNKLEWLEAANSGDPARVLEAQRHIQRRLRDAARGAVLDTPSLANLTSAATGPTPTQSPSLRARSDHASPSPAAARDEWEDDEAPPSSTTRENRQSETELRVDVSADDAKLGLDGFLAKYDGEDNASFRDILQRQNEAKRRKMAASFPELAGPVVPDADAADANRLGTADGAGSTALTFPRERVKNDMFFRGDGACAALTAGERAAAARGPPKATVARNTRFETADEGFRFHEGSVAMSSEPTPAPSRRANGGYGYGPVATPSPAPGVDDSPFMTWGDIESTPTRLDAEIPANAGERRFRVKPPERRERALRRLTAGTPNRTDVGTATPKRSAAAKSLAKRMRGGAGGASPARARTPGGTWEGALRGAYSGATPTPERAGRTGGTATTAPTRGTPGRVASGGAGATPRRPARGGDVTDDLLHL